MEISKNAEQLRVQPYLEWEPPDEDGDIIVHLRGVENWHLVHHGKTELEALAGIGAAMSLMTLADNEPSVWDRVITLERRVEELEAQLKG